jgi:hypothetical protein
VETFLAPHAYWRDPPPYVSDAPQGFLDFGVTIVAGDLAERPSTLAKFPLSSPGDTPLIFWNVFSHKRAGDVVTNRWLRPDGAAAINLSAVTPSNSSAGFGQAVLPRGNFTLPGVWHWVREVNGVEKLRVPFEVAAGAGAPAMRVSFQGRALLDDRTTPVDFGAASVNGAPVVRTLVIENHGFADLTLGPLALPPGFALTGEFPAVVPAGQPVSISIQMEASRPGVRFG